MEKNINYTVLKNAVINDLKMNGMYNLEKDEYPKICDYLWDLDEQAHSDTFMAWNTAQDLFEYRDYWKNDIISGNIEKIATDITHFIEGSFIHYEETMFDYGVKEDNIKSFDNFISQCNLYIEEINRQALYYKYGEFVAPKYYKDFDYANTVIEIELI